MSDSTKQKILQSATNVFVVKGYSRTRMRDISEDAGINKGLLHYYFKTKKTLFTEVLKISAEDFFPRLDSILHSDKTFFEKLELIVDEYIEIVSKNPHFPPFIINELNHNTDLFVETLLDNVKTPDKAFVFALVQEEIASGRIRPINPLQFILDVLSLILYPFLAKPGLQKISGMSDIQFYDFMRLRKRTIVDTLINNIKI